MGVLCNTRRDFFCDEGLWNGIRRWERLRLETYLRFECTLAEVEMGLVGIVVAYTRRDEDQRKKVV